LKSGVELNKMTKKLVWRLKEQPTSESLQSLVISGLLTKDEAREVLFNSETEEDRDKKSLESEIKFLRELVEKLSKRSQIVEVIKEISVPYYQHYPWYEPYQTWCIATDTINPGTVTMDTGGNVDCSNCSINSNFSDISTF